MEFLEFSMNAYFWKRNNLCGRFTSEKNYHSIYLLPIYIYFQSRVQHSFNRKKIKKINFHWATNEPVGKINDQMKKYYSKKDIQ